jgi:hypothetical protein
MIRTEVSTRLYSWTYCHWVRIVVCLSVCQLAPSPLALPSRVFVLVPKHETPKMSVGKRGHIVQPCSLSNFPAILAACAFALRNVVVRWHIRQLNAVFWDTAPHLCNPDGQLACFLTVHGIATDILLFFGLVCVSAKCHNPTWLDQESKQIHSLAVSFGLHFLTRWAYS